MDVLTAFGGDSDEYKVDATWVVKNRYRISVLIAGKKAEKLIDKFWETQTEIDIKDVRKGRTSRRLLEKMLGGRDALYSSVFSEFANHALLQKAVRRLICTDNHVCKKTFKGWQVFFDAWFYPDFEFDIDFDNLEFFIEDIDLDEYVDRRIHNFKDLYPYLHNKVDVEGNPLPAAEGDMVEVSIEMFADGQKYVDGCEECINLRLLPGYISPDMMRSSIEGLLPGNSVNFYIDPPKRFKNELEGKKIEIFIDLLRVYRCEPSVIDDDLAMSAGYDSLQEWKDYLKKSGESIILESMNTKKRQLIISELVRAAEPYHLPQSFLTNKGKELIKKASNSNLEYNNEVVRNLINQFICLLLVGRQLGIDDAGLDDYNYASKVINVLIEKVTFHVDRRTNRSSAGNQESV